MGVMTSKTLSSLIVLPVRAYYARANRVAESGDLVPALDLVLLDEIHDGLGRGTGEEAFAFTAPSDVQNLVGHDSHC